MDLAETTHRLNDRGQTGRRKRRGRMLQTGLIDPAAQRPLLPRQWCNNGPRDGSEQCHFRTFAANEAVWGKA